MDENRLQLSLKQKLIVFILFISMLLLSCKYPDVVKMVMNSYFGPTETIDAIERNRQNTDYAIMVERNNRQNTENAGENNRKSTEFAVGCTQTAIANIQTSVAMEETRKAVNAQYTADAKTITVAPQAPAIVSIRFPREITTDVTADGFIEFYDANGDINRVTISAIQAELFSPGGYDPPYSLVNGDTKQGTYRFTFTCGYSQFLKLKNYPLRCNRIVKRKNCIYNYV